MTAFDEFTLQRYAAGAVPLTLAAAVGSLPVFGVIRRADVLLWWQTALALGGVAMLFVLAWLSRVCARRLRLVPVAVCLVGFAGIATALASWEVWLTHRGGRPCCRPR
ncbi:MAG: hypothetical protein QM589_12910 [Thermomicrobiales bacterium]